MRLSYLTNSFDFSKAKCVWLWLQVCKNKEFFRFHFKAPDNISKEDVHFVTIFEK